MEVVGSVAVSAAAAVIIVVAAVNIVISTTGRCFYCRVAIVRV